jgi:hypothetical protein
MTPQEIKAKFDEVMSKLGAAEQESPEDVQKLLKSISGPYQEGEETKPMNMDLVHKAVPREFYNREEDDPLTIVAQTMPQDAPEEFKKATAAALQTNELRNEQDLTRLLSEKQKQREELQKQASEIFPYLLQALQSEGGGNLTEEQKKEYEEVLSRIPFMKDQEKRVFSGLIRMQQSATADMKKRINSGAMNIERFYKDAHKFRSLYFEEQTKSTEQEKELQRIKEENLALTQKNKEMEDQIIRSTPYGMRPDQRFEPTANATIQGQPTYQQSIPVAASSNGKTGREFELQNDRPMKRQNTQSVQNVVASRNVYQTIETPSFNPQNLNKWGQCAYGVSMSVNASARDPEFHRKTAEEFHEIFESIAPTKIRGEKFKNTPYFRDFKQLYVSEQAERNPSAQRQPFAPVAQQQQAIR